jgi:hypothetical protein
MTAASWPHAVPFDPESGAASHVWEEILASFVRVPSALLFISGEAARYSGWSARAAVELADALASRGRTVFLVDLHVDAPDLRELADANAEGISDVLLFGSSFQHVARPVPDRAFRFIPAGPAVPDAEDLLRHEGWTHLVEEAVQGEAVLLVYVPWRARGLDALHARFQAALFLGGSADARIASGYLPPEPRVIGVVAPHATGRPQGPPPVVGPAAAEQARVADSAPVAEDVPTGRRTLVWTLGLALLAFGGAAVYRMASRPETVEPPTAPVPAAPVDPGVPVGDAMLYSVAVESHQDLAAATERVAELKTAEPAMGFYLTPILVDSVVYYRVQAGPVRDSTEAALLQAQLIARGYKADDSSEWDIRSTPFAFLLGTFDVREAAAVRAADLAGIGIPAYMLEVPYSGGVTRYHLYCGAYAGPSEADVMRRLLGAAGLDTTLVQRVGRTPS